MTPKFFSAWEVHTKGIGKLLKEAGLPADTEVWRAPDGSYATGGAADLYDLDDEPEYTSAGTVAEYLD